MKRIVACFLVLLCVVVSGCSDEIDFSVAPARATIGFVSAAHDEIISLPSPREKIAIAVYRFRDQTGQYKTSGTATTFSTAVTQGATSMLVKALQDSGWFIPIEREGLPNLLNERKIIRSTQLQYQSETGQKLPALPPMMYAGVLVEGGIISYDTNFITGGIGVRYFGIGGSGQLRKDRVTIYLRLVSVKNGQVLKTVSTTKSILSKEVDFNVYRYVKVQRLLETEVGFSTNEPPSMCVLEALEKAVLDLVIEGIQDGLWSLKDPQDINSPMIQSYLQEKRQLEKMVTLDKKGRLVDIADVDKEASTVSEQLQEDRQITTENKEKPARHIIGKTTSSAAETKIQQKAPTPGPGKTKSAMSFLQEAMNASPPEPPEEGTPITVGK